MGCSLVDCEFVQYGLTGSVLRGGRLNRFVADKGVIEVVVEIKFAFFQQTVVTFRRFQHAFEQLLVIGIAFIFRQSLVL